MNFKEIMQLCGGVPAVARHLKIRDWAVRKWEKKRIPAERCAELEKLSNGKVSKADMRPDLWEKPKADEAAE